MSTLLNNMKTEKLKMIAREKLLEQSEQSLEWLVSNELCKEEFIEIILNLDPDRIENVLDNIE